MDQLDRGYFVSDLWVVDVRSGARIVACRSPWAQSTVGQDFSAMLSKEELARVTAALMSYATMPVVSETVDGQILLILPSLMPSSTMALVLVPSLERKMLLRFLLKRSGMDLDWNDTLFEEASGRLPGKASSYKDDLELLLLELKTLASFSLTPDLRSKSRRFGSFLKKRVEAISALTGCEVSWDETEPMVDSESFDFGMATAFLLISLLICRTTAQDRAARVGWSDDTLRVGFLFEETSNDLLWGRDALDACAEERQMPFATTHREGYLYLSMKPRRLEFSYLGIKAEDWMA